MRRFAALALLLVPAHALAETALTAVATGPKQVVVGVRSAEPGAEPVTSLVAIDAKTRAARSVPLPKELAGREVIALLPAGERWLVVTQWTMEQGDAPQVHGWNPAKKSWKKLGTFDCTAVIGLRVEASSIVLRCEDVTDPAAPKVVEKKLALDKIRPAPGNFDLPQSASKGAGVEASLEGTAPDWDRVRVKSADQDDVLGLDRLLGKS